MMRAAFLIRLRYFLLLIFDADWEGDADVVVNKAAAALAASACSWWSLTTESDQ